MGAAESEVVVEGGGVAMQQQEELAAQKEALGHPALRDQQDLVDVAKPFPHGVG